MPDCFTYITFSYLRSLPHFIRFILLLMIITSLSCLQSAIAQNGQASFIVITDIHFDPFIGCSPLNGPCDLIKQLDHANSDAWPAIFSQNQASNQISRFHEDTSFGLLTSLTKQISSQHPQFIIILGDSLGHNIFEKYKRYSDDPQGHNFYQFEGKLTLFLAATIAKALPAGTPIYPVIGNHEPDYFGTCKPVNFDCEKPAGFFLKHYVKIWSPYLYASDLNAWQQQFSHAGFYSITPTHSPQTKLIILNSNIWGRGFYLDEEKSLAKQQFHWLQTQLATTLANHQKAWIVAHIPPNLWKKSFRTQFLNILQQYPQTVTLMLTSHLHRDASTLLFGDTHYSIINLNTPALSPAFSNNPSYRLVDYDSVQSTVNNVITYYLPENGPHKWQIEYDFRHTYLPHCQQCPVADGLKKISLQPNNPYSIAYMNYYAVDNPQETDLIKQNWSHYWHSIWDCKKNDASHHKMPSL